MAWFPCNIGGGGPSGIANILKGTSDPTSSIGENGQLYLKYGADSRYIYDEDLGGYCLRDYYAYDENTYLCSQSVGFYKLYDGAAISVYWHTDPWYGPILISTDQDSVKYTTNTNVAGSAVIDGVTWYISTDGNWNATYDSGHRFPILNVDYVPEGNNIQRAIEDILEASGYVSGNIPIDSICDSFAKVNNQWQSLIGTDIDDILAGGSKYIKTTGSFTSGTAAQQKVEVNCGFKPDLVMVDMEFGNGFSRATYLSTAWYEATDHPISVWDLRPMESVIYAITPESVEGETGITDLTSTGFKYRVNGYNTQGKACTYTAIKFDSEASVIKDLLYSINESQGGVWINSEIDTTLFTELLFEYTDSVSGADYTAKVKIEDIAVYTGGADVFTTVFPSAVSILAFNVRIYNNELYVSFNGSGGVNTKVVGVYKETIQTT